MAHSDDQGLILPPKLAPIQVVIVPIYKTEEQLAAISERVDSIVKDLKKKGISVKYDSSDANKPGWKFAEYELKGVPIRLALGGRDLENGTVEIARRDTKEKQTVALEGIVERIENLLEEIQENIHKRASDFRDANTFKTDDYAEFQQILDKGGFILAHWDGTSETEDKIKEETKATIRCIPYNSPEENGKCIKTGQPSSKRVLFARAY